MQCSIIFGDISSAEIALSRIREINPNKTLQEAKVTTNMLQRIKKCNSEVNSLLLQDRTIKKDEYIKVCLFRFLDIFSYFFFIYLFCFF